MAQFQGAFQKIFRGPVPKTPQHLSREEVEIRPNWRVALRVWWSIAWRAGVLGVIAGGIMKLALDTLGREDENLVLAAMSLSLVVSVGLEVWLIRHALTHHYGGFRIAVMKRDTSKR